MQGYLSLTLGRARSENPNSRGKRKRAANYSIRKGDGEKGRQRVFSGWRRMEAKDKGNKWEVH